MGKGAQPCLVRGAWSAPSLWNGPLLPIRDSVHVNTVGEPCEGKSHARFDEGRLGRFRPNQSPTLPLSIMDDSACQLAACVAAFTGVGAVALRAW